MSHMHGHDNVSNILTYCMNAINSLPNMGVSMIQLNVVYIGAALWFASWELQWCPMMGTPAKPLRKETFATICKCWFGQFGSIGVIQSFKTGSSYDRGGYEVVSGLIFCGSTHSIAIIIFSKCYFFPAIVIMCRQIINTLPWQCMTCYYKNYLSF